MNPPTPTPTLLSPSANGSPHAVPGGAAEVVLRFQDVMAKFLDTQRSVMLGYLGAGGSLPATPGGGEENARVSRCRGLQGGSYRSHDPYDDGEATKVSESG